MAKVTTRKWTCKILDLVDDGVLDARRMLRDALNYMSEADVADLAHDCGLDEDEDENDEPDTEDDEPEDTEP